MTAVTYRASAIAIAAFLKLAAQTAVAQDLSSTISCLHGIVPGRDYAQLGQRLSESMWDSKGGVALVSEIGGLKLRVLDTNGNSVCDGTANNTTSCRFRVDLTNVDEFDIIIDNANLDAANPYKVCAY